MKLIKFLSALLIILSLLFGYAYMKYSNNAIGDLNPNKMGFNKVNTVRGDNTEDTLTKGQNAIVAKDYNLAINILKEIPEQNTNYTEASLLIAYSHYELKNYSECVTISSKVINSTKNKVTIQKAEWLMIQAQLADENTDDDTFMALLNKVAVNENHIAKKEANNLKKSINSFWRGLLF